MKMRKIILLTLIVMSAAINAQDLNLNKYRKKIEKKEDTFSSTKTYHSPLTDYYMYYAKIITEKEATYIINLKSSGNTYIKPKEVKILLENGEVLSTKNIEADVKVSSYGYDYSATIIISGEWFEQLKNYNIKAFTIGVFEENIKKPEKYRAYLLCLEELK